MRTATVIAMMLGNLMKPEWFTKIMFLQCKMAHWVLSNAFCSLCFMVFILVDNHFVNYICWPLNLIFSGWISITHQLVENLLLDLMIEQWVHCIESWLLFNSKGWRHAFAYLEFVPCRWEYSSLMVATAGKSITHRGCRGCTTYSSLTLAFSSSNWLFNLYYFKQILKRFLFCIGYSVSSLAAMQVILFPGVMIPTLGFGRLKHQNKWE